ncbi:MAG TPA: PAS domain S-box protein, partial [Rhodocyclaceae bacterium]
MDDQGDHAAQHVAGAMRPPSVRSFVLAFAAVAAVCIAAAGLLFTAQKSEIEANARRQLGNIALLKAGEIDRWRQERYSDATLFGSHAAIGAVFDRWLARGAPDDAERRWMDERLATIRLSHDGEYQSVMLLGPRGQTRIATAGAVAGAAERRLALEAMAARRIRLGDITVVPGLPGPVIDLAMPLLTDAGGPPHVAGAMVFRVDPAHFIYPAIESWPIESRSAETLLVRREGDDVVFLNRLRHSDAAPLSLRLPLASPDLPAARALRGETGFVSGTDYRGEPVAAYLLPVPGTEWALVAKMDEAEIYAPIRALAWYVGLAALVLLAFAAHGFWTLRRRAELAFRGYQGELQNRMLAQRLDGVAKSASDIIVLTDDAGRVVEVNDRAVAAFGYTRAEMLGMMVDRLRVPECRADLAEDRRRLMAFGSGIIETTYRRKDGSSFSADVSAHVIRAGGQTFFQAIVRDVTERKRTEAALRLHEQMTRKMQEGLTLVRAADGVIVFANPKMEAMFGYAPGELCGKEVSCVNAGTPAAARETAMRIIAALEEFGAWSGEVENRRKDGSIFWCKATVSPFEHPDHGKVWLAIHTDITEQKTLDQAHARHLKRIRELGRHLVAVQETERRRLGAELHDRTAANLAAAKLVLRDVAALVPAETGEALANKIEDLQALIADTNDTIRDISINLRPPLLDFLGLCATLKSLGGKFSNRSGIAIDVRCRHIPRLEGEVETLLYRIVEETLTNSLKHAGATRIDVLLLYENGRLKLSVADDGDGIDSGVAGEGHGAGLLSMRERVEFADGHLVVESMPG